MHIEVAFHVHLASYMTPSYTQLSPTCAMIMHYTIPLIYGERPLAWSSISNAGLSECRITTQLTSTSAIKKMNQQAMCKTL